MTTDRRSPTCPYRQFASSIGSVIYNKLLNAAVTLINARAIRKQMLRINQLQGVPANFALPYLVPGVKFRPILHQVGFVIGNRSDPVENTVLVVDVSISDPDQRRVEEMLAEKLLRQREFFRCGDEPLKEAYVDCRLGEGTDAVVILPGRRLVSIYYLDSRLSQKISMLTSTSTLNAFSNHSVCTASHMGSTFITVRQACLLPRS